MLSMQEAGGVCDDQLVAADNDWIAFLVLGGGIWPRWMEQRTYDARLEGPFTPHSDLHLPLLSHNGWTDDICC